VSIIGGVIVSFEYTEYYSKLVGVSLLAIMIATMILIFSIFIFVFYDRIRKITKININRNKIFYFLPGLLLLYALGFSSINYRFLFDNNNNVYQTEGIITEIINTENNPKFIFEGKQSTPKYIIINDEKYYVMHIGELKVGDEVQVEYLQKSKVILEIHLVEVEFE